MFDFTDEQKMVRKMVRQWADKELAPLVPKMEKGELLPYDTMRKLLKAFGMDEMVRSAFARMKDGGGEVEKGVGGDPSMAVMVSMELARVCPGFTLAFGASLGLA